MTIDELRLFVSQFNFDVADFLMDKQEDLQKFISSKSVNRRIAELETDLASVPDKQRELDELKTKKANPDPKEEPIENPIGGLI